MGEVSSFLGGGATAFKFEQVGDKISGVLSEPPIVEQQREFIRGVDIKDRPLATWPDGQPKMQMILTIETDSGEEHRIYVSKTRQKKAIGAAVRRAGAKEPEVGGWLEVERTEDERGRGSVPAQGFKATYVPPTDEQKDAYLSRQDDLEDAPF